MTTAPKKPPRTEAELKSLIAVAAGLRPLNRTLLLRILSRIAAIEAEYGPEVAEAALARTIEMVQAREGVGEPAH